MVDNNKAILVYGFSEEEEINLQKMFFDNNLPRCVVVEKTMCYMTINHLLNEIILDVFYIKNLPEEKVILFNNLSDAEINKASMLLNDRFNPKPIIEIVNPKYSKWSIKDILERLIEERKLFEKRGV